MQTRLFQEILMARKRVYAVGEPTPLQPLDLAVDAKIFVKREDLSPIHAYKWRGAYNRMALLTDDERDRGVVAASAGNHAQGVALAARRLETHARIFMPISTPRMKQAAVRRHGADAVEVVLVGDTYDAAAAAALEYAQASNRPFIHPYDDLAVMGGQGTLADEVVMSGKGPFDVAYLQIGGGGMAGAVACWLKAYYPGIRIVGVEGVDQASMAAAVRAGQPVTLDYVDVFCDGTAVKKAGILTHEICSALIDEFITVTNEEVCAAIELLWEARRCVAEPSGAMGLAGALKQRETIRGQRVLTILCGANLDFDQLAWISRHAGIGARRRRYFRFEIDEQPGRLLHLLDEIMGGVNIIEVQYGKMDESRAWPVIGCEASPMELALLDRRLSEHTVPHEDVTSQEDVEFRIINYEPQIFRSPYFITLQFPERAGALRDFLTSVLGSGNICYFNYTYTGEQVGRALIGFEFARSDEREAFRQRLQQSRIVFRELSDQVLRRVL
ncbi:MAG: pyridoxal-phosphate dependent enzyme [Candidatus Hydrogenedentes bacterium]|nr:pyridoxal-phosphate dependent enzyme [Candidatus Hydrogenedentota bacterium]